jgi:hypothetical protein
MQEAWGSNPHSSTWSWVDFEHYTGESEGPGGTVKRSPALTASAGARGQARVRADLLVGSPARLPVPSRSGHSEPA